MPQDPLRLERQMPQVESLDAHRMDWRMRPIELYQQLVEIVCAYRNRGKGVMVTVAASPLPYWPFDGEPKADWKT